MPGEIDNAKNNARCTQGERLRTAWMDNIKTWTGLPVEESIRMTEDRDKWIKYVYGMANPRIKDGLGTEQMARIGLVLWFSMQWMRTMVNFRKVRVT